MLDHRQELVIELRLDQRSCLSNTNFKRWILFRGGQRDGTGVKDTWATIHRMGCPLEGDHGSATAQAHEAAVLEEPRTVSRVHGRLHGT